MFTNIARGLAPQRGGGAGAAAASFVPALRVGAIGLWRRYRFRIITGAAWFGLVGVLVVPLLVTSCARRPEMGIAGRPATAVRPTAGKALVLFIRPGLYFGKGIGTALYDGDRFVGLHTNNTVVAYQADPGSHLFMLLSGQPTAPAFLDADLVAGRIYYVHIAPRSAWTRPPFHLVPLDPQGNRKAIDVWTERGVLLVIDEHARRWDQENHASAMLKREDGLRRWQAKDDPGRPVIRSTDGIEIPGGVDEVVANPSPSNEETPRLPDTPTGSSRTTADRLRDLDRLRDQSLITDQEYQEKRRRILEDL